MSGAALPGSSATAVERADLAAWLAVLAGALGTFMAMLDISIVNASLPTIQSEIGATPSEGTWIGTSYLVAEIVIIPLTVWLERLLGLRRLLLLASVSFTVFSMLCGIASDLATMIVGRVGQGISSGTLIPTALTIIATRLPPRQQPIGIALFGASAMVAPVMGPLIGGWITESLNWRYTFFINLPICTGLILLLLVGVPKSRGNLSELRNADWFGIAGMVLGLGALTVLLEEGHRELWFESRFIWQLAALTLAGFGLIAWGQFNTARPVARLALLRDRAFASIMLVTLMGGALIFGSAYVTPQFLAMIAGYNALQAGGVVFISGVISLLTMPFVPLIITKIDLRIAVTLGLLTMAASSWVATGLTAESVGSSFMTSQILLGVGLTVTFTLLNQSSISSVAQSDAGDAAGLFMSARNLGGSIGLAAIATIQDERLEVHRWQLHSALSANDIDVQQRMADLTAELGGGPEGLAAAYRILDGQILVDAMVMSYNDVFLLLMFGTLAVIPFVLFLRPLDQGTHAVMH